MLLQKKSLRLSWHSVIIEITSLALIIPNIIIHLFSETALKKSELVASLRSDILALQGFRAPTWGVKHDDFGLGPVMKAFPEGVFLCYSLLGDQFLNRAYTVCLNSFGVKKPSA